jgi:2'-5' RNA ligase
MNEETEAKPARIFVGLKINPEIAEELAAYIAELKETRARLVAPADVHLTLVPPWQEVSIDHAVERLTHVAGEFAPFALKLEHLGYGPHPTRPSLLWVVCAATDEVTALHHALMQAFGQEQRRPFRPHITLARIHDGHRRFARRHPIDKILESIQTVRTVELFRSPPPRATGYQILASIMLERRDIVAVDDPAS